MKTKDTIRTGKVVEVLPRGTISKKDTEDFERKYGAYSAEREYDTKFDGRYSFRPKRQQPTKKVKTVKIRQKKLSYAADYVPYEIASTRANELLWSGKSPQVGFYISLAINSGLRAGDLLNIRHADVCDLRAGDYLTLTEQKTKKVREIKVNDKIVEAYQSLLSRCEGRVNKNAFIFTSQKGTVFAVESMNRILKELFKGIAPNISTHSLRKSFGRHVFDQNKQSELALVKLSQIFCHANVATTRRYLGLTREEIGDIYMNL